MDALLLFCLFVYFIIIIFFFWSFNVDLGAGRRRPTLFAVRDGRCVDESLSSRRRSFVI